MLIGLDISTSIVGVTILDDFGVHQRSDAIILPKSELPERAIFLQHRLSEIIDDLKVSQVWIEEPFQRFARGGSTAATMMRLATFNGMCQLLLLQMTDVVPCLVNANAARKSVGLKIKREKICGISTKDQVLSWVKIELPNYAWPQKTLKSGPRKGQTINCPSCFDIADSFVVAKAGFVKSKMS